MFLGIGHTPNAGFVGDQLARDGEGYLSPRIPFVPSSRRFRQRRRRRPALSASDHRSRHGLHGRAGSGEYLEEIGESRARLLVLLQIRCLLTAREIEPATRRSNRLLKLPPGGFRIRPCLVEDLKAAGAKVWLDELDIKAGEDWDSAVHDALARCSWMLVVLSPASIRFTNVQDEIALARDEGKTIIPISYQECLVPWRLRRFQRIDFVNNYDVGLTKLLTTLGAARKIARLDAPPQPQPVAATLHLDERSITRRPAVPASQEATQSDKSTEPVPDGSDEFSRAEQAAAFILASTDLRPHVALVLGSGLGNFAGELKDAARISYADIPHFPKSTAIGHAGTLVLRNLRQYAAGGDAKGGRLLRGLHPAASRLSRAGTGFDGRKGAGAHQCGGWNQPCVQSRRAGRVARPYQLAGWQSSDRRE